MLDIGCGGEDLVDTTTEGRARLEVCGLDRASKRRGLFVFVPVSETGTGVI